MGLVNIRSRQTRLQTPAATGDPLRSFEIGIADAFRTYRGAGFTQLEIMLNPGTMAALEALAPVLELLDAD
jgi:hypothetical protein